MGCLLKTSDTTPRISWTHNDPESDAQIGYQVQIDRSPRFNSNGGNPDYDSGDMSSANQYHDVSPALNVSGKLYVRVRTRDATHGIGEGAWADGYFILDTVIDSVGNAPYFYFTIPSDPDNNNLHFEIQVDFSGDFTSPILNKASKPDQAGWEYYNGSSWVAIPSGGVSSTYYGNQARYKVQPGDALSSGAYAFRIRARDD